MSDQDNPEVEGVEEGQAAAGETSTELTAEERAKLAELDENLEKFEGLKRWSDYIKTIIAKAELVKDPAEKVELYSQAGEMYLEKSSNQAEAIKCYQAALDLEPTNLQAIERLKEMYEKRRDWERLVGVMQSEAQMLDEADRLERYLEIAKLGTERLRKPDVCIGLWQNVLEYDDAHPDAIDALASLYERARDWGPLAEVLEKQSQQVADDSKLGQLLLKLGSLYADKLNDDEGAVRAFKRLLEVEPDNRRAQEQLKKRYAALRAWDELEEFYAASEKWDELIRTLEREADNDKADDAERIGLLFRVARLWADKKEKPERGARAFEKVLTIDPDNLDAAVALTPIYEGGRDPKKLASVYEVRLKHITDDDERMMLLRETGLLYEERLKDPATAFERFLEGFELAPLVEVTREDVERLAPQVNGWERVVEAYAKAIEGATDPNDINELRVHSGRTLAEIGRVDDAIEALTAVYQDDPTDLRAAQALEPLFHRTERYADLLEIYQRRMDAEEDPEARKKLAYDAAALQEKELAKPEDAVAAYLAILDEWGDGEVAAFDALEALYERLERWGDFAGILQRRIDVGSESLEELAALKFRLARTQAQYLDDTPAAVELYREILSLHPEHEGARESLEKLLDDSAHAGAAAEILEPMYEGAGEWEKLVRALDVLTRHADTPEEKLRLLVKVGQVVATQIGDTKRAYDAYARALREVPGDQETMRQLEVLALEQERFADVVALVMELAGQQTDAELARRLYLKSAELYATQLGNADGAVTAYTRILEADPGDLEVLGFLEELYRHRERWSDLLGVLRKRVELTTDPAEQERLLSTMATVHQVELDEPDEAIARYREVLEIDPASHTALRALDTLFETQQRWTDLADNVGRQLELAESEAEQIALMLRLAGIREERMGSAEAAIEIFRDVLARESSNQVALAALERLLQQPEQELAVAEILEPLYRDAGEFAKLVKVHEIQLRHAESAGQKVELLHVIAEIHETQLGDLAQALGSYARALEADAGSETTQAQLERLAGATGEAERLARIYEERVGTVEDPAVACTLYMKAAEIRETQLSDYEAAIAHYRRVLELDDTQLEAASALERLFQLSERYTELAEVYLAKARMLADLDEQKQYLFRSAQLYEEMLDQPATAVDVYKRVLELDAEEMAALDRLVELYLRMQRWQDLLGVYERKVDITADPDAKKPVLVEMGAVYESELQDNQSAIDTYQRILEVDPTDQAALARLDALYVTTENWDELLSVLEREADLTEEPYEQVGFRYRVAELFDQRLGDHERAVEGFREILQFQPDHGPTLQALENMIAGGRQALAAAEVLDPIYRQLGDWRKLAAIQEVRIRHEEDPVRKVELLHGLAELLELQLDDPRAALEAYGRSLPLEPANENTLSSLERLAAQLGSWSAVADLYDASIRTLREADDPGFMDLALRCARICEVQVEDVERAIGRYRWVIEADPAHVDALEALDRLYESTHRWEDLADVLRKEVEVAPSPDDMLNLQFRLGQLFQVHLNNIPNAVAQYRDILAAAPEYQPAMSSLELLFAEGHAPTEIGEVLEPLYRMQESWTALIGVHEVQLQNQADPIERVTMMHRVAEIAEERAQDSRLAFLWMQRALLEEPMNDHTEVEVERLARDVGGWSVLANTYADVVSNGAPAETRAALGRKLAGLYENELEDIDRAEESYRFVLGINRQDRETLQALDRIYQTYGAHDALAEVLRLRVGAAEDDYEKIDFSYRLAQVLDRDLGRTDEAIEILQGILRDLDPEHLDSINALEAAYSAKEDWQNLYATYQRARNVVIGDSNQSDVVAKMAALAAGPLGQPEQAAKLWNDVLDLRGEDPEALKALGELLHQQGNWKDLVDILEREASVAEDDATRVRIYADLGRVWYEKLERSRNALESWERVLDLDPGNTDALLAMARIHRDGQAHHELVDTLHRLIEVGAGTLEDAALEAVYMELGQLYDQQLEQPADAVEAYNKAIDLNLRNFTAMDELERIHTAQGDWEARIGVKERRVVGLEEVEDRIAVLLDIARSWAEDGEARERGVSALDRVLELSPLHESAFAQLEEIHTEQENWEDLIGLYLGRIESTEDAAGRIALLHKVADVYEKHLEQPQEAFDAMMVAWSEDYTHEPTADAVERLAAVTQGWNQLLTAANETLHTELPQDVRVAICLRCAKWYGEQLERPDYAIPYYQQILQLDPQHIPAMLQMAELYRTTKQWETVVQVLSRVLEVATHDTDKMNVYVQLGELCANQLGQPEQASSYYSQALDLDGAHLGALEALERIYRENQQWDELLEVLRRKTTVEDDPEAVQEAWLAVAEALQAYFDEKPGAIEAYEKVLEQDPANLKALRGIEPLYRAVERWQDLPKVLESQLDVVTVERDQIEVLLKLGAIWEEHFVKPEKAIARFEQVLDIDPNHLGALEALTRLYRQVQRWDDVIQTLERKIAATDEQEEKIAAYKAMGRLYASELKEIDRAIDAFINVTSLNDQDTEALDMLTRMYERAGDHASAIDTMEQQARLSKEPETQVDLHFRMGQLLEQQLGDRVTAVEHYEKAIDIDPAHLPSLEAMRKVYLDNGDWIAASRTLQKELENHQNPRILARLGVELGRVYADKLDEPEAAIECFETAYRHDDTNEDAALPLVDEYVGKERWADALPLLQMLTKQAEKRSPDEQHRLAFLLGQAATKTDNFALAVKAYGQAYTIDNAHLPTVLGLAEAHFKLEDWEKAGKFYQLLLMQHRDGLAPDEVTHIFHQLGAIKVAQGERRKALNMFDKALEEDAHHRPTLGAVIRLHTEDGNFEPVIQAKKQLLEVADDEERLALLQEIAELWQEKLNNQQKAIEFLSEAAALAPENHVVLHKLLGLYQSTKQWQEAVSIIDRIADMDERTLAKSKYAYTVGVILRDELKDVEGALERFNIALDLDATQLKAFEAINKLLTQLKDWKQLERAFRKMLHRLAKLDAPDTDLQYNLWHNLGVIYRDRQKNYEAAAQSFKMASDLKPEAEKDHQILAELYGRIPDQLDKAIEEYQFLLARDPAKVEPYRSLYSLYFQGRQYDKAWCVARTLVYLKKADSEQQQFYEQYKRASGNPNARVTPEGWLKHLYHPDHDKTLALIFRGLAGAVHESRYAGVTDKHAKLGKEKPVGETSALAGAFNLAAQVLVPDVVPRLFANETRPHGLMSILAASPASIAGRQVMSGLMPNEVRFVAAHHIAYHRGEHYIRKMLPARQELKDALLVALRSIGEGVESPGNDQTWALLRSKMSSQQVEELQKACKFFVKGGARADIKRYIQTAELTACRAGLLLANDLEATLKMVSQIESAGPDDLAPGDKIKEMLLFSVSESYFALRQMIGVTLRLQ